MEYQPEIPQELQSWADGISMIYNAFKEYLKHAGVEEMTYDSFDPEYHEALLQVEADRQESGTIVRSWRRAIAE